GGVRDEHEIARRLSGVLCVDRGLQHDHRRREQCAQHNVYFACVSWMSAATWLASSARLTMYVARCALSDLSFSNTRSRDWRLACNPVTVARSPVARFVSGALNPGNVSSGRLLSRTNTSSVPGVWSNLNQPLFGTRYSADRVTVFMPPLASGSGKSTV